MDIIWNITRQCHYKCAFCVVGNHIDKKVLSSGQLNSVIKSMSTFQTDDVDISGGEPLLHPNIRQIIESLNKSYGRKIVSLTSTGRHVSTLDDEYLKDNINCYDFTYDYPHHLHSWHRPSTYNRDNLLAACRMINIGIKVKAQIPLFKDNVDLGIMSLLLDQLAEREVMKVQLIRLMPLGNQKLEDYPFEILNKDRIREIYAYASSRGLEAELHCSLKGVLGGATSVCNMIEEKIGVNHAGEVLSCPWADHLELDRNPFVIGDLLQEDLNIIMERNSNLDIYDRERCDLFDHMVSIDGSKYTNDPLYDEKR